MDLISQIVSSLSSFSLIEWGALLFGILYVILAAKENIWCWPAGFINVVLLFVVYIRPSVRLYSEAALQLFYAAMALYGWYSWRQQDVKNSTQSNLKVKDLSISKWQLGAHLQLILIGVALSLILGWSFSQFGAALPYVDATTTSFSILATYLTAKKILENWIYWIIIDLAGIFISINRELYLFAVLFFIYMIIAMVGYREWKVKFQQD